MPNLDTANIALGLIRSLTDALLIGPLLEWAEKAGAYRYSLGNLARDFQYDRFHRRGDSPPCGFQQRLISDQAA